MIIFSFNNNKKKMKNTLELHISNKRNEPEVKKKQFINIYVQTN
jgi:hypothetical protein